MSLHYPDEVIDRLQLLWGQGFMSPGGPEEVHSILSGIDVRGKSVLDIGCGTGGPSIILARDLGARVTAVDVEDQVLDRARAHGVGAGVGDLIDFVLVAPGPLPFADATFDFVFSKDALIHIPDKKALYRDVIRILRPGGQFVASDWLSGENAMEDPAFREFAGDEKEFAMATAAETATAMREAGFADVTAVDRNAWYARLAAEEARDLEGPLRDAGIAILGPEKFETWLSFRKVMAKAAASGGLRPTHLRARRPA